jgi:transcriptional regulator with XRE-family HTH domain
MKAVRDLRERRGLTQSQLAEHAGTSQPTIAAYESGAKSPNLRTLERLARSVGLEAVVDFVPTLTREERRSLLLHRAIAERLRESPELLLERARRNLAKMEQRHPGAAPTLSRWHSLLNGPTQEIIEVLLDPRPSARELRHVTPFAGALSAPERTAVYRRFRSTEADPR